MTQQIIDIGTVANDRTGDTWRDAFIKVNDNDTELYAARLNNRIIVTQASDLSGSLSSTDEYFLDGVIDMGSTSIEVPAGGLNIAGYNFDISGLTSASGGYTMFTSPAGGSGNVLFMDFKIDVSGAGSQVYNITSDTGLEAIEISRINYNNCESLGTITAYRQGLETGTGRFGGKPELTLAGTWVGGYFIDTSIVRSLSDGAYSLYKAGAGFSMASRFRSNQNIDLPASASFFDFAPAQFVNPSTVQLDGVIISRNGVFDSTDTNITPNMSQGDLSSSWDDNVGMENTFEGGTNTISTEVATVIGASSTFVDLLGTFTASDLQHFDSPANGQLRHLGFTPREYKITAVLTVDSTSNNVLNIKVRRFNFATTTFTDISTQARQVNALVGGRDVAFFTIISNITLDQNDYVFLQISNDTGANNATAELDSFFLIEER